MGSASAVGTTCSGWQQPPQTYLRKQRYAEPETSTVTMMMMVAPKAGDTVSLNTERRPPRLALPGPPAARLSARSLGAAPGDRDEGQSKCFCESDRI